MEAIHINDSYKIKRKSKMKEILLTEYKDHPVVKHRKMGSLTREWTAHNRLYRLGLFKSHTKDVDLEYPIKWYYNIIWNIIGL